MRQEQVPVLIVGGGGAGLTASMLLARLRVDHLLVSARPVPPSCRRHTSSTSARWRCWRTVAWLKPSPSEALPRPDGGHRLLRRLCRCRGELRDGDRPARVMGGRGDNDNWRAASPWCQLNLPQIRLEPILKAGAERLSPGRIRFNHELLELEQDDDGVRARARQRQRGALRALRLPARCGRRAACCAAQIGVEYEGLGVVTETATLHVSADFSRWARDPDVLIRWIASPQAGTLIVMVPMGPSAGGRTPRSGSSI